MDPHPLLNSMRTVDEELEDRDYAANIRSDWVDESCCGFRIAYFPVGKFHICEHWRTRFKVPIEVCIVFITSYILFIIDTCGFGYSKYHYPNAIITITSLTAITFVFFLVSVSYFQILFRGPGYAPYNWCVTKQPYYDFDTMMSSIALYQEQVEFGRRHERPNRASFSIDARRYVLRADHFCFWTQSWIGQNNIRYFILLTFWVSIYCLLYIGLRYFWAYDVISSAIETNSFDYFSIIGWVCVAFCLGMFFFSFRLFIIAARNLSINLTLIEKWKLIKTKQPIVSPTPERSCLSNYEEVCGPRESILCWPFPFFCKVETEAASDFDPNMSMYTESTYQKFFSSQI